MPEAVAQTYSRLQRWCATCARTTVHDVEACEREILDKFWKNHVRLISRCLRCAVEVTDFLTDKQVDEMASVGLLT